MSQNILSPRAKKPRLRKRAAVIGGVLFLGTGAGIALAYSLIKNLPNPERITERAINESTRIYDRTGTVLLYEIHGDEKRTIVPLSDIPDFVIQATLAAEDINFYRHAGLDIKGISRALLKLVVQRNITQGGSTITQQLIKNSLLTSERTFTRKIKEALLALLLERKYSKDEILALYLNQVPYGSNAYGIAAAAQLYFAKPLQNLSLAEAATLAALLKAPTRYSPYGSHKEELFARTRSILERMAHEKLQPEEKIESAKKEIVSFAPPKQSIRAPHFVMYVREYLNQTYGEEYVEREGLRVLTTLDWTLQEQAEKFIFEGAEQNEKLVKAANAALVAIDPGTGDILAMVGSKNYWDKPFPDGCTSGATCRFDPHVNVTTRNRQPGSAFKPFVYATAFKKGYAPETVLFDAPTEFNPLCNPDGTPGPGIKDEKDCYHPKNYDGNFRGPVSLRQAIAQSLNLPSVKLLYLAGIPDVIETAQEMGISTLTDPDRYGLSLVLGGAEVSLLEMVSAFGVFSQEGVLHPKTAIIKIENPKGRVLEEKKNTTLPVLDTDVARIINGVLSDNDARVPIFNPRSSLYFPGRAVAAKTGTTQDSRDAWVIGYTPSLAAGVWVGNSDNAPMQQSALSIMVAGPIWHRFLEAALANHPPESFIAPEKNVPEKPVLRGLWRSGAIVKIDTISRKLATEFTPPELIEEISTGPVQTILSLLKKEDPLGPPPAESPEDPQFKNWQEGINRWLTQNPLPESTVPTETDTLHAPDKRPRISFVSPREGEIEQEIKNIVVTVEGVFPLREVSLFMDDDFVGSKTGPFLSPRITFQLEKSIVSGSPTIKITAYDAVGNRETKEAQITITEP